MKKKSIPKAWIIDVNMGYGHQRTAYPLRNLAPEGIVINANSYQGIPKKDRQFWNSSRKFYEFISNFKRTPLIGQAVFSLFDRFQKIFTFYPYRDLSKPNFVLKQLNSLIEKGWGRHLIEELKKNPLPIISTFFTPAYMAERFDYPGDIYCVVCDADIARVWASFNSKNSRIKYFAPTPRVVERLKLYGVKQKNIFLTGYPLPLENIGDENIKILKQDMSHRIINLDPKKRYIHCYEPLIKKYIGEIPARSNHPLTLTFSVGGAGAQKDIGMKVLKVLSKKVKANEIKINLVAGIREKVAKYFQQGIKNLKLDSKLGENIDIIFADNIQEYFQKFNKALRTTDILWTKPSELSFYSALGIPIIIAPTVGSQEEFNQRWLLKSGFGVRQENPSYVKEWLFDWLENGYFAESAMQSFIEGEKMGAINIEKIICSG